MSLSSLFFMFCFLPGALIIYYIFPKSIRKYVLFAVSFVFYAMGSPDFLLLFLGLIILTVILGRILGRSDKKSLKTVLLVIGILLNLSALVFYKYFGGGILPLGISFYTFKAISFLSDVYRGEVILSGNPFEDALYLSFFGQVISGPITRRNEMNYVLESVEGFKEKIGFLSEGLILFLKGFVKKILLADTLSRVVNEVFTSNISETSAVFLWLGSICFSLELYFDFSGYSDMAIGITKMFGYDGGENFNYPYVTSSISGFWKRWHISLSSWFKDYVYIPLGGSRNRTKYRTYFNLLVVWVLTGIWHGTGLQFIVWGLGYFVLIALEKLTGIPSRIRNKPIKCIYRVWVLACINFLWVFFNADSLNTGLNFVKGMIINPGNSLYDRRALFLGKEYLPFIAASVLFSVPVIPWIKKKISGHKIWESVYYVFSLAFLTVLSVIAVSMVVSGQNNPFAYATF